MTTTLRVKTNSKTELIDITVDIEKAIRGEKVANGLCFLFVPHTTAAITINENADPDVIKDMLMELDKIVPLYDNYCHAEGNSAAHIKSSIVGCSREVIIEGGQLQLGTWQSLFFCEFDGPRSRQVWVKVMGQ